MVVDSLRIAVVVGSLVVCCATCGQVSGIRDVDELAAMFRKNEDGMFEIVSKINKDSKVCLATQKTTAHRCFVSCALNLH